MTASAGPAGSRAGRAAAPPAVPPAGADGTAAAGPEAALAGRAAGGEQDAFEELYRRHVPIVWRFAQAVSTDRGAAERATQDAFIRVLRIVRRGRSAAAEQFGPYVLAAVYREAQEIAVASAREPGAADRDRADDPDGPERPDGPDDPERALAHAFVTLPQRWRAALWLTDIEQMALTRVAPILGEPAPVTTQLVTRARTGLASRFSQSQRPSDLPDVPATLRAAASLAVPAGLAGATLDKWHKAMAAERHRVVPVAGWWADRAPKHMAYGAAGLLALGLIGLGVLGQRGMLGGGRLGGPSAAPNADHNFSGPPSASLQLAGASSPFAPFGGPFGTAGYNAAFAASTTASSGLGGPGTSAASPGSTNPGPGGTATTTGATSPPTIPPTLPPLPTIPTTLPPVPTTLPPVPTTLPPIPTTLPPVPTTLPPIPTTLPTVPTTLPIPTTLPTVP